MRIESILRGIYLKLYFFFKKKMLFTDGYNLKYYLYKNTRPNDTFNLGVRTDDTTVLYTIDKILTSPSLTKGEEIHCFDVGGYIGIVTLMMSKVLNNIKKKWKIHTFEPFEDSFKKLQENINLDSSNKNIELNYVAVSDVPGTSTLETYQDTPGENHLKIYNLNNDQPSISFKNIKVITLRDYINKNNIKNIAICKVDTEGADYFVIKGLHEHLENQIIDYFIFEYQSITYEKIKKLLIANGYTIYHMVRNENILVRSLEEYPKQCKSLLNCVAVSEEKKNNFIEKLNTV